MIRRPAAGLVCLGALAAPALAFAYFEDVTVGARGLSLGPSAIVLVADASAYHWNPAALAELASPEVLLDYAKPHGIADLNAGAAVVAGRRFGAGWSAGWRRLALADAYGEDVFSIAAGRRVLGGSRGALAAGAAFKLGRIAFQPFTDPETGARADYGALAKGSLDLGLKWVTPWSVDLAWVARDVLQPRYEFVAGSGGDLQVARHEVAAAFRWDRESTIIAGWSELDSGVSTASVAMEILFFDVFAIRSGIANLSRIYQSYGSPAELQYNGGFGVYHRGYHVDAAVVTNRDLGASYRVTLRFPLARGDGR